MSNIFQTSSLNIVAWLLTKGYPVKDKKRLDDKTIFYFDRVDTLQSAIDAYNNNTDLKEFISNFRQVKIMAKT